MTTVIVQVVIWLAAIMSILCAAKLLIRRDWLGGWLRGSLGLLLLGAAFVSAAMTMW